MDPDFEKRLRARIDGKTKPPGSLGRVEDLAARIARIKNSFTPRMETCELTIFAADHGIASEGVSAYPQEVTVQMLRNFLDGGAASTVFASVFGVPVRVVDAGTAGDPPLDARLLSRRIGRGTANSRLQPAMTRSQLRHALDLGKVLGAASDTDAVAYGEMGIASTSAAALVAHRLTGLDLVTLTGRGTGLDDAGVARKRAVLSAASARVTGDLDATEALSQFGGFEIAMMAGAMIGAAEGQRLILVDGFIATAAALAAENLSPESRDAMVFAHVSAEAGHRPLLDHMKAEPLLSLGMRLGEGTGALMAWPMVRAAAAMLNDMASFDDAGVSGPA
jgi:nicotinate-nucleotide--dimethylbenzimidazole phosphoribosyltransferase